MQGRAYHIDDDDSAPLKDKHGYDPELGLRLEPILRVIDASISERLRFIRNVYTILSVQLLATLAIVLLCSLHAGAKVWVQSHLGAFYAAIALSFFFMCILLCFTSVRKQAPLNLVLLGAFTLCEGYMLGVVSSLYQTTSVLQAIGITAFITVGLTVYTFTSKRDFSKWGMPLFVILMVFVLGGFLRLFLPSTPFLDTVWAVIGALLFSAYIVFDTFQLIAVLNTDEYIEGAIQIYLDIINLFLYILQIFGKRD